MCIRDRYIIELGGRAMGSLKVYSLIYNYITYTGKAKNYDQRIPRVIKYDPLVIHVRRYIRNYTCPFCEKKFSNSMKLLRHLAEPHECKKKLDDFIYHTVERYLMFRSVYLKRKILPTISELYNKLCKGGEK